jgi:murein L,D-transpeptidase YcbB/YkuD
MASRVLIVIAVVSLVIGNARGRAIDFAPAPQGTVQEAPGGQPPAVLSRVEQVQRALAIEHAAAVARLAAPEARDLAAFYVAIGGGPAWLERDGRLMTAAVSALDLLSGSAADGLEPRDYEAAALAAQVATFDQPIPPPPRAAAAFDVRLTAAMLRYFRHLHLGRVDPRTLGLQIVAPDDGHDFADSLRAALERRRLAETAAELAPPLAQYAALKAMLARYRALAATSVEPPAATGVLEPGDSFDGLATLHRLLVLLGDLRAGAPRRSRDSRRGMAWSWID